MGVNRAGEEPTGSCFYSVKRNNTSTDSDSTAYCRMAPCMECL